MDDLLTANIRPILNGQSVQYPNLDPGKGDKEPLCLPAVPCIIVDTIYTDLMILGWICVIITHTDTHFLRSERK